jgi:phosphoribosylformylglycinamidine synthase
MKFGVVVFPGSNCDHDTYHVVGRVTGQPVSFIWHQDEYLQNCDAIILPGGFAYGDYLRTGAIARFSPVMKSVSRFVQEGGLVVGICNGFQILLEAGLLPGAMQRNAGLRYVCRHIHLSVEQTDTPYTASCTPGQVLRIPVGHGEGNYTCDEATLAALERNRQVVFRYVEADGRVSPEANPNGSIANIAGICNRRRNVLGMMPHPERAAEAELGGSDGVLLFRSLVESFARRTAVPA